MEISRTLPCMHPQYLTLLFAFRHRLYQVFQDVLGLHQLHHISISHLNQINTLVAFSSTPALEFNLLNSPFWQHDLGYQLEWVQQETQASWPSLYDAEYFDELYTLKQGNFNYKPSLTISRRTVDNEYLLFSFASRESEAQTIFFDKVDDLLKIGQYCYQHLLPLFNRAQEY